MQQGNKEALKKGVKVYEKGAMSVYVFADHHLAIAVQLIRTVETQFPVSPDHGSPEGSTTTVETPLILMTKVVKVHGVEKTDDIKPAVQRVVDELKAEAEKVLQSDQRVAGILGDYKSQRG